MLIIFLVFNVDFDAFLKNKSAGWISRAVEILKSKSKDGNCLAHSMQPIVAG